ncbi:MAG: helix-turn-helix transcriptional regulator [Proteobacteria bacterium]|nr:helix-turn-helix transcriptional regulator [Pseudomonadota bacterium]
MIDINAVRTDPEVAKVVQAAFRRAVGMINGRWKLEILWLLSQGVHRFGELKRGLPGITQHMLTAQLRGLEKDGLIKRTIYAEVPPRVEYEITPAARRLRPIFVEIVKWAEERAVEHTQQPSLE